MKKVTTFREVLVLDELHLAAEGSFEEVLDRGTAVEEHDNRLSLTVADPKENYVKVIQMTLDEVLLLEGLVANLLAQRLPKKSIPF